MKKYVIVLMVVFASFSAFGASTCSKKGTVVIYTNGIATERWQADLAKDALDDIIYNENFNLDSKDKRIDKNIEVVKLAYNYQESIVKDILESAVQRLPQSYIDAVKAKNKYEAYSLYLQGKNIEAVTTEIKNSIVEAKLNILKSFADKFANVEQYQKTINEMLPIYNKAIADGFRIYGVSHSQGSLFMRDVHNLLPENFKRKYFTGYQIASVLDKELDGHFDYATHSKDAIVNMVRFAIGALSSNLNTPGYVKNSEWSDFFLNHGIQSTYLYDDELRPQVIKGLLDTGDLLESNCNKAVIEVIKKDNLKVEFSSLDPDDKNVTDLKYLWNFGDGQLIETEAKSIVHVYTKSGLYNVSLKVINLDEDSETINVSIEVRSAHKAVINIVSNNNLLVNFNSIDPLDPNVTNLSYSWDFGDGKIVNTTSKAISHNYLSPGVYNVVLKATNSEGLTSQVNQSVQYKVLQVKFVAFNH